MHTNNHSQTEIDALQAELQDYPADNAFNAPALQDVFKCGVRLRQQGRLADTL